LTKRSRKRRTRRNARRALQYGRNRESAFKRDVNHCISKTIIREAKDTKRGVAVENLTGIRSRTRFRKGQRARMSGWSFAQLRGYIEYKGRLAGVPVVAVDPRNTSRTCHQCGHCDEKNRPSQAEFRCLACGFAAHADINAAQNIRAKALADAPQVAERPQVIAA
jgi:putative transposase